VKTILITAIGGDIAQCIASIVREEFPQWRILGCDTHDRHGAELLVDRCFVAPKASSIDYGNWIESLVVSERVDLCIPMSEAELGYFVERGSNEIATARLVMANAKAIEVGSDKLVTARFLLSVGCPAPWTIPVEECRASTPFPCIFKPRRGAGSRGVFVCNSAEEALFFSSRFPAAVLQELLLPEDREVTCAIYRTGDGRIAVLQLMRKLVGGFTGWARVIDDPEIGRQCEQLAESLNLCGSINAQLRITDDGPRIFEINARFSSTVLLRHRMGFRDVVWSVREMLGEAIQLDSPLLGMTAVRTQGAALLMADCKITEGVMKSRTNIVESPC
jgi:carbamoyl-phosphate synthase large subunit